MTHENGNHDLVTRTGLVLHVRPVGAGDEKDLAEFFAHVTPEDLRFRFLASMKEVSHQRLRDMIHVDHHQTEHFLAFAQDGKSIIATAMVACDANFERAEVAISVRADHKYKGVGWEFLRYVAAYAQARGIKVLESVESRENYEAIELEREQGFDVAGHPDDPGLVLIRKKLGQGSEGKPAS